MSVAHPGVARASGQGVYAGRAGRVSYGIPIGILMMECNVPFVPGDVGNASSYDFPVLYRLVPGATGDAIIVRKDRELVATFVDAAVDLARQGVRAITGDCGYMATYQPAVAEAVDVPVFLSSLLQIPLLLRMLHPRQKLGVICASEDAFSDDLLAAAGVVAADRGRLLVRGLQSRPHSRDAFLAEVGQLDFERVSEEVVETAEEMRDQEPMLGGYLLECSDLPPYSAAIQEATGLPVFDWVGFINYVHHAVVRTPYHGIY